MPLAALGLLFSAMTAIATAMWRVVQYLIQGAVYLAAFVAKLLGLTGVLDAMIGALETYLPDGSTWNIPDGGFYVWLTVPEGVDTKAMLPRAVTARVAYASGTGFYADGFGSSQLRLSYCYPTPERITEGVRRLAAVLEAELDVMRTFGSPARPRLRRGPQAPSPDTA